MRNASAAFVSGVSYIVKIAVIWSGTPNLLVFLNLPIYFILWWLESQPLTSDYRQPGVLRPRHHRSQLGRTQNQHVQKAAVRSHHKHRRVLQVRTPTLHLDPREPQAEEDESAQQPDDRVKEPAAPTGDRSGALLIRQTSQSEPGDGPRDEEENWSQGEAQREEDAAEDDTLCVGVVGGVNTFTKLLTFCGFYVISIQYKRCRFDDSVLFVMSEMFQTHLFLRSIQISDNYF